MSWAYNILKTINDYALGREVNPGDKNIFMRILNNFVSLTDLETLWHIASRQNADCANRVFGVADYAILIAVVAYVIMPLDAIPDFIPFTGYLDDIGIVKYALNHYGNKIQQYRESCM